MRGEERWAECNRAPEGGAEEKGSERESKRGGGWILGEELEQNI